VRFGGFSRPFVGLSVCGDSFTVERAGGAHLFAVIDGLGHGHESSVAAERAIEVVRETAELAVADILMRCHAELRVTRGAAVGLLKVEADGRGEFCGIGNIEVQALAGKPPSVFCLAGIVGHNVRVARPMPVQMSPGDVYCLLSDGVSTRGNFKSCLPGAPAEVARRIVERFGRSHDDATAVLLGYGAEALLGDEGARD
jgi:hypothetical protein